MNWKRMSLLPFPLKIPFPKFSCRRSFCEFSILDVEPETSNGHHNFLLQHETREMGVTRVVSQRRAWTRIMNLHPDLIAFFQVQRRLDCQRTELIDGHPGILVNSTRPDSIIVQIKLGPKPIWSKMCRPREREKINSRSRCREFPRAQIHCVSLVHQGRIEFNRSVLCGKFSISLDVEVDGRRFDVDKSDPFLKIFSINYRIKK